MGLAFTKIWQRLIGKQEMRILMVGLDAAGKTTILYKLKLGEVVTTTLARMFCCCETFARFVLSPSSKATQATQNDHCLPASAST